MMNKSIINIKEVEVVECPICMDEIEEKNKVTTECGHCFHTSCLMKNVAHNGFGCPYCRTVMAEEPADNNSDEEYDEFSLDEEEGPDYSDNVLRGARWLFQRAEGEDLDDEEDSVLGEEEVEVEDEEEVVRPSVDYIVGKLVQRGVTMEDFVKTILLMDHDEFENEASFERVDSELYGKFRAIITSFRPSTSAAASASASASASAVVEEIPAAVCHYETTHYKSSRLRKSDSDLEDMCKKTQLDKHFYDCEKLSELVLKEEKEEQVIKMPFSFQMKGSCCHRRAEATATQLEVDFPSLSYAGLMKWHEQDRKDHFLESRSDEAIF